MAGNPCFSLCCKFVSTYSTDSFWTMSPPFERRIVNVSSHSSLFTSNNQHLINILLFAIYFFPGLILLFLVAWPIAGILTPFWLLLQPLEACCSLFADINGFLERFIVWPRDLGQAIMDCSSTCPQPWGGILRIISQKDGRTIEMEKEIVLLLRPLLDLKLGETLLLGPLLGLLLGEHSCLNRCSVRCRELKWSS